jgi:hypothetical protein
MAWLQDGALDQRGSHAELRDNRGEVNHDESRAHHAERRGGDEARQDSEHDELQNAVRALSEQRPEHSCNRLMRETDAPTHGCPCRRAIALKRAALVDSRLVFAMRTTLGKRPGRLVAF